MLPLSCANSVVEIVTINMVPETPGDRLISYPSPQTLENVPRTIDVLPEDSAECSYISPALSLYSPKKSIVRPIHARHGIKHKLGGGGGGGKIFRWLPFPTRWLCLLLLVALMIIINDHAKISCPSCV